MIGYLTLGTNDMQRAARFYDALLAEPRIGRRIGTLLAPTWAISTRES